MAVSFPSRVAPSQMCCSCSSRCPQEVNIWPRVTASRTGRRTCWAAIAVRVTCGQTMALAAERAADEMGQHPDLGRGDAEQRGHGELHRLDALARVMQRELVAVPHRRGGQHLQRVVVVGGEPERRVDADLGSGEPGAGVAARGPPRHQAAEDPFRVIRISPARLDRGDRRGLGVADPDQGGGVLRLLPGAGHDDRDRLPGVADDIVLHREKCLARCRAAEQRGDQRHLVHLRRVVVGQDPGYPVGAGGLGDLDRGDPAAGDPGAEDRSVSEVRQRYLTAVPG